MKRLAAILTMAALVASLPFQSAWATEADTYWMCKTSQPVGWCPASNAAPLPVNEGPFSYGRATGDTLIKTGSGFVHTISIAPLTASVTAGLLTVYDNTAESGSAVIYTEWILTSVVGHTIVLNVADTTGVYVGFDATLANVAVTVSYR